MADFVDSLKGAIRSVVCGYLAATNTAIDFVGSIVGTDIGLYPSIVRSIRRTNCSNPDNMVATPPQQDTFTDATASVPSCTTTKGFWWWYSTTSPQPPNIRGTPAWVFTQFNFGNSVASFSNFRNNGGTHGYVDVTHNGTTNTVYLGGGVFDGLWRASDFRICAGTAGAPTRPSNLPPLPPGTLAPYVPVPVPRDITYDGPSGPVTEGVQITIFAPVLIAPLTIVAPIIVTGNQFTLSGEVTLSPEFKIDLAPTLNIGFDGFGDIGGGSGVGQPPDEGKQSVNRKIIGALVICTDNTGGRCSVIAQGDNPDIYVPRLGSISFLISTDKGRGWTTDLSVKNTRQYIPCPAPQGAVDVRGTPDTGYAFDVIPIYNRPNMVST